MFMLRNMNQLQNFNPYKATIQLLYSNDYVINGLSSITTTVAELMYDWWTDCNICPCNNDWVYFATIYIDEENNKPYPIIGLSDFEELAQVINDNWYEPYNEYNNMRK